MRKKRSKRIPTKKKRVPAKTKAQTFALGAALAIGIVLIVAAIGKLFYPAEFLKDLERWISVVEILLIGVLFFFRKHWQMWLGVAVLFAAWSGYALFWYTLKLPCNCMGTMLSIPTFFLVALDLLLFVGSMAVGYLLGAKRHYLYLCLFFSLLMGLAGFAFAEWIYTFDFATF